MAKSVYCGRTKYVLRWDCKGHCSPKINPRVLRVFDAPSTATRATLSSIHFPDKDEEGEEDHGRECLVIAFRGSVRPLNWANNLMLKQVVTQIPGASPRVRVHAGFWRTWRSVRSEILISLDRALSSRPPNTPILVCGHSLGGALAQLCAADLKATLGGSEGLVDIRTWTIGQPRVGNRRWSEHYASLDLPTTRIVHSKDLFPHLGPKNMGWRHAGDEWWVRHKGTRILRCTGPAGYECKEASNSFSGLLSVNHHLSIWGIRYSGVCMTFRAIENLDEKTMEASAPSTESITPLSSQSDESIRAE
ncbi:MAG: Alpha/Beta hydrolase protein [Piptocephalis tieghemiana]|nr:MAG: Alpha/Beta hydrolase protein [Piptocephalis tieghemiana]